MVLFGIADVFVVAFIAFAVVKTEAQRRSIHLGMLLYVAYLVAVLVADGIGWIAGAVA